MSKLKKLLISALVMVVAITSTNITVFAEVGDTVLAPGDVAQNKTATWSDYANGIAEISFDVVGKSAEEPVDVVIVYDNSGSMQLSEKSYGDYLTSRWYYASQAAKTFSDSLLQNEKNSVALVPFSDALIDGNSSHSDPSDLYETHDLIYDKNGNPDILKMISFAEIYDGYITGKNKFTKEDLYKYCETYLALTRVEVDKIIDSKEVGKNTKNAVVSFTKDREEINTAIDSLYPSHAGQTNYEIALEKAQELFSNTNNRNSNKVIVMISDGKPNIGGDSVAIAKELKDSGVTIYTCGTAISDSDATILKKIASVENNSPFYSSSKPSDLEKTLEKIRKEIGIAAEQAVITDEINSEYFEYFIDATHYPTVNGVKITSEEMVVSENKDAITWKIGNIREEVKTLKFYVKIKDSLLNQELLSKDQSILNKAGDYSTNKKANLTYKEADSDNIITSGHEMESPELTVNTASMKQTYYLSDANGNYIEKDGEKVVLWEETSHNKALNIEYTIAPKASIEVDGVKYFILKEDNKETKKTFTNNDANALFAYRYVEQLNVTFDANELGQFSDDSVIKDEKVNHDTMTVNALPKINVTTSKTYFTGWNTRKDGKGEAFDTSYIIKNNMTVYAQYAYHPLNVVFQDENDNVYNTQKVEYGADATAPKVPDREGYTFVGWDKDFTNVTTDLVVTSKFEANKYTVTFDGNGATSGTMRDQEFTYDVAQKLNKNVYERENHTFTGWLYNNKIYTDEMEIKNLVSEANGNITFVAQWREANKYTVVFQDEAGNLLQESSVYEGADATAPKVPDREGYTFVGWDKDFTNVTTDLVVTSKFEANKYTVTFDGNGATSGTMRDQEFTYDVAQKLNKNVYERENHTFTGWLYNNKIYTDEMEIKNLVSEANGNITFVAQWREANKYTVVFQDNAGNLLQESSVYEGADATAPTAPTRAGYRFVGWDKDFTNVRGNLIVTAIYEANIVIITPPTTNPGQPTLPTETPIAPIAPIVVPPVRNVPGVVNPPVVVEQPETPAQEETVTPPADNEEIIDDQEVPLGTIGGSWALVNLICTIVVTVLGIFLLLAKRKKEEDDEESEAVHKRRVWAKVATVAVAIVTIVAFIITEDVTLPMVLTDKWTIAMVVLTLIQLAVVYVGRKWKEDKENQTV